MSPAGMTLINEILAIIAPVMIISLIGYVWERRGMPFDQTMIAPLVINVGTPCLLLNAMLANRPDLGLMAKISVATLLLIGLTGLIAWVILKAADLPVRVFLPAMVFGNTGNVGLPLCLFAFGPSGLALAVAFFATQSVLQFSIGQGVASGRVSVASVFKSPALYALLIGCALIAADVTLPRFVMNSISTIAGLAIPLMLMSLGVSLASLSVVGLRRSVLISLFCVFGGFALGLAVVWAMGLEGAARGAVVVQAAMPSAVFNYLFAVRYDNRPSEVAGIVVISTIISFLTLPLLMAFVLRF